MRIQNNSLNYRAQQTETSVKPQYQADYKVKIASLLKIRLFLFFILLPLSALTAQCDEIVILGNYDKPPKIYLENGYPRGFLIEIMQYLERKLPYNFKYQLYPWRRAYKNALNNDGGIIGLSKTSQRETLFDYSEAIYLDEVMLVVLKSNDLEFDSVTDLKGLTIGIQRGASYGDLFDQEKNSLFRIEEDKSGRQRLKKLLSGRIDAALLGPGRTGVEHIINQDQHLREHRDDFRIVAQPFKRDPNHLGFAKTMNMTTFLQHFNEALLAAKQAGQIDKIISSYRSLSTAKGCRYLNKCSHQETTSR
ncbi:MAG: transporter substrate-binding domain-containing protein [Candidatus Thiodiazotropha lotti]|uniref:Solute-binding protein family 3/N-terminal domain-containing protein n=1 Tax=Candidatus Thiodiazotropha endoloripes TaxID=1818881 RepID=A0A1E2UNY8_9GAMM|nr:transporter substrate-binding domain-containing protein [Candidatus Thiodiazotropha endoloripes]MCG7898344.1 transporter substrate-binding domain-containing protein [Candidatus Thiodiazotropha weberae]MCG7993423.1 transporter substrate-binding domain-containing protein [Candidatus Thiodiazotropha lotti]MCG7901093.1 transporter substrate-binding domain-containing protein [Candidatus Thiodiazotropha weberae]MCG7998059.1 transporter substrate-binding domain-containing protein [Candidatus Thiodi